MLSIFFNLAGISITVSIVIVLLLLLSSYLDERYAVKWRYYIWLVLAIRLMLPFDFGLTAPPMELNFNDHEIFYHTDQYQVHGQEIAAEEADGNENNLTAEQENNSHEKTIDTAVSSTSGGPTGNHTDHDGQLTVSRLIFWIYLAGVSGFLLRQLVLYLSFRHGTRRWCREVSCSMIPETMNRLQADMGIEKNFRIRICRKIVSPMITGLFKPTLILPHEEYQKADLEVILKHELIHFRRKDLWFKLLLILSNALHWFNPFAYMMVQAANQDIEISCDEEVLRDADLTLRKRYSERILELMQGNRRQKAPVSTNFHGGKQMMKSRIRHIFDERPKKKGVPSFCCILVLVLVFSACQFGIGQNQWEIPISISSADAYGYDEAGGRNSKMSDVEISLPFDLDQNGSKETVFSLTVAEKGETCFLKYQKKDEKTKVIRVFDGAEPGVDYSLQAANLAGTDSIMLLASVDYHGMTFGSGYWELFSWDGTEFERVDMKSVEEILQLRILERSEADQNRLHAGVLAYLYNPDSYPADYPVLGLYSKEDPARSEAVTPNTVYYLPLSEYDVEGYRTWGQDAVNKAMTGMKFVSGEMVKDWDYPGQALLETTEIVFITMPNITATVKCYYQYQNGRWIYVDGIIE